MQYIRELAEYNGNGRAAVTFGKFDGLHRGHQMLVTKVRELGKQENINSIVCSFETVMEGKRDCPGTSDGRRGTAGKGKR